MNTETRNYENERAVLATAIMCDNRQAKLEEKARKYDELKEALNKIRAEIERLQKEQSNHYGNETETAKYDSYDDCLDVIDKYREVIYEADSN